ncbi:MAG: helix-turn-helix transcriptional regulator, partial [Clostridia bacterium]|nr:helix-turn-helix transcriptional regulator [Clostridia bacterium]
MNMVKNLKVLRNQMGISQQHLAEALGISQQSVNRYENHKVEPDINTLIKMADFFGVSVDILIGRTAFNTVSELHSSPILQKYNALGKKEKICVDTVINTLLSK